MSLGQLEERNYTNLMSSHYSKGSDKTPKEKHPSAYIQTLLEGALPWPIERKASLVPCQ
jgi:hypothetical protein